ncbi:MAG: type III secretion system export apparatus subunit SctT [Deltaproteobacteria bacterium]|nr:type III secretion system export apparatus subunit SctT [Deltaproteobacteria bacterium]
MFMNQGIVHLIGYVRLLTFFFLAPFLSGNAIPGQLRIAMAFMLSLLVYPTFASLSAPPGMHIVLWLLFTLAKELLIGILLAYVVSILFWAMLSTGFLLDNQRGASMAQVQDAASDESTSIFGSLLHQVTLYIMYSTGAFTHILILPLISYGVCPPGFAFDAGSADGLLVFMIGQFGRLLTLMLVFSAPIVLICLFCDFALGVVNRFSPQLNVFFMSMPIKSALGLAMVILYLGTLLPLVTRELFEVEVHARELWQFLSGNGIR